MCCRYWAEETPELVEIIEEMNKSPLAGKPEKAPGIKTHGEIRPTDVAPVIASSRSGDRAVFPMKWGFSGKKLLVNARSETASEKAMFRDAWAYHRCIVPASGYFEWEHTAGKDGKMRTGDKYAIRPEGGRMTWLCGLYRIEDGIPSFVILTREPGEKIRFIHNRMPLIMPDEYVDEWIRPGAKPEELVKAAITEMDFRKVEQARKISANVQLSMDLYMNQY